MPRFADPTLCPDCGATLPVDPAVCPRCGLPLRGPVALSLHQTLRRADDLLIELRASASLATAGAGGAAATAPSGEARSGLRGASVPRILLGLGALCLLVAAVTFLAVAWSWLGLGGRTAVLLALTLALGGGAVALAGRGLRVAAESLGTVALGLVALDVAGGVGAGWLGDPDRLGSTGTAIALGLAVLAGSLVLLGVQHARDAGLPLVAPQLIGTLGLAVATAALVARVDGPTSGVPDLELAVLAGIVAGLGLAVLGRVTSLRTLRIAAVVDALWWWVALTVIGITDAAASPTPTDLVGGAGLGAALAGAVALAVALAPLPAAWRPARSVRVAAAAAAAVLLSYLVLLPAEDAGPTTLLLTALAGVVLWSAVAVAVPGAWRPAAAAGQLLLALPLVAAAAGLVAAAATTLENLGGAATRGAGVRLAPVVPSDPTAWPWLVVPAAVVLAGAVAVHLPAARRSPRGAAVAAAVALGAGFLALPVALASYALPLWSVVAALVLPGTVALLGGLRGRADDGSDGGALEAAVAGTLGTVVWLVAVAVALPSAVLTTLVLAGATALALLTLARATLPAAPVVAGTLLPVLAGGLVWSAADLVDVAVRDRGLPVLVVVGLVALLRVRVTTEVAAVATGLVASTAALLAVVWDGTPFATALALHLTVAGALVTASALVHPARRVLGWPGAVLLAAATWVRLADLGVSAPEAYTLPSALALVLLGVLRLRRDPAAPTLRTLAPGLVLATVPSLLWVLAEDPVSLRAALLGAACLAMVLTGVVLRWGGPVLVGAVVGSVLVLAELAPYAGATPQWVLIGLAGTVLTVVGVTWEQRMREVRALSQQLARLR